MLLTTSSNAHSLDVVSAGPLATSGLEIRWKRLLAWLEVKGMKISEGGLMVECRAALGAGNGLFAIRPCRPSTILFSLPGGALINLRTLEPHYPDLSLTATQLISLHLFLHRPVNGESLDPLFGPYISILPQDFDSHPLTWLVTCKYDVQDSIALLQNLPPSVLAALHKVGDKFWHDWGVVRSFIKVNPFVIGKFTRPGLRVSCIESNDRTAIMDFTWAWLNGCLVALSIVRAKSYVTAAVNTRCIYHRIKASQSDQDNLTLCPILDFANHSKVSSHLVPPPFDADLWNNTPRSELGEKFLLFASHDAVIKEGEELCLTYGLHSNRTLFVEYGFVNEPFQGKYDGEVDVQDIVEQLFQEKGAIGVRMKEVLTKEKYWGDWTLHSSPSPAHPSHRLITTLRLYDFYSISTCDKSISEESLQSWRDTLIGKRYAISEQNEQAWRSTLVRICTIVIQRAESHIDSESRIGNALHQYWIYQNIAKLWKEEKYVAEAILQSIQEGEQF